MEYIFIVNPKSRSGRGGLVWNLVEPELKKKRIRYKVYYTKYTRHAAKIASEATADGQEHTLVVVGGDGTVNEVVNGICDCSKVTLGYIPTGSGNDFTRALRLPSDFHEALEVILHTGKRVPMDVGRVSCKGSACRFAVSTGIGFDAAVCHQAAVSPVKTVLNKLGLGKLTYLAIALKMLFMQRPGRAQVCLDGDRELQFEYTYFAAVMNHPYEGGGFFFCPEAQVGDGMLDVIVASGLSKWKILLLLPTAFKGKHVNYKGISIYRCKEAVIKMSGRAPVHADGEPIAVDREIRAALEKEQLHIIAP